MDVSILKKLDLGDKEIKVYLTLLEYGNLSVRSLAELTGLNRGTAYDILKRLQEQGLASYFHQTTKQQFVAEPPEHLLTLLEKRERELEASRQRIVAVIPELKSLMDKGGAQPVTKFYEGKPGIRAILTDVFDTLALYPEKEYYAYSAKHASEDLHGAYPDFTDERIKRGIRVKIISMTPGGQARGLDERRWLGSEDPSATFVIIYGGKCAFVARDRRGNPVGVLIENNLIYNTQKMIFLKLWEYLGSITGNVES